MNDLNTLQLEALNLIHGAMLNWCKDAEEGVMSQHELIDDISFWIQVAEKVRKGVLLTQFEAQMLSGLSKTE